MSDKGLSFIICVNDKVAFEECKFYINSLNVPDDFKIEIIPIESAESISKAYNFCMEHSHYKYKVYLHQDVFIRNKNFINDILNIFNLDEEIGIIGMCGAKTIPPNGVWWDSIMKFGKVYESHTGKLSLLTFNEVNSYVEEVECVDGLLMATQYDVKWREDIFKGWHFYDSSQCLEHRNHGYKVVIPRQDTPWCIHDCGIVNTANGFDDNRQIFLKTYKDEN